jgi:effector-binding domain-containing protein
MGVHTSNNVGKQCKNHGKIDAEFVEYWQKAYDSKEHDEEKYKELLEKVKKEIKSEGCISKRTFKGIYKWKTARTWYYVKSDKYNEYEECIREAISEKEDIMKVKKLRRLPGVGIPVASTILHFIYPERFPIVDIRTVEALQEFKKLEKNTLNHYRDTFVGYGEFRCVMLKLKRELQKSLRKIDKALFAYHKICLSKNRKKDG